MTDYTLIPMSTITCPEWEKDALDMEIRYLADIEADKLIAELKKEADTES